MTLVLVVHPENNTRSTISHALGALDLNVQVVESSTPQQGITLARELRPDLIFTSVDWADETLSLTLRGLSARVVLLLNDLADGVLLGPVDLAPVQDVAKRLLQE
ncbi:MAG: hypothetical protein KKA73_11665 [Chloroflexi bacterium]|nr:hypothetical protein [Chloroflexota bacterium]MBU1748336.1 hypothetical protein [Chloroflexota bacterium]